MKVDLFCGAGDIPDAEKHIPAILRMEAESYGTPWTEAQLKDTLQYDYNMLLVLTEDDETCGYLIANMLMDTSELLRITVDTAKRRCGYGRALLEGYLSEIKGLCETGLLEVRESNTSARALYERAGYRELSRRKNYYSNPTEDAVVMEITC